MKELSTRLTIERRDDPQAFHKDYPCKGCEDFCETFDENDVANGSCNGVSLIRQTTYWLCVLEYQALSAVDYARGEGQSAEEAHRNAISAAAATVLRRHPVR